MRRTVRAAGLLATAGLLIVGLGACGDDDDEVAKSTEVEESDLASKSGAGDAAAFCDAAVAVDAANLGLNFGESSPEDLEQAMVAAQDSAPDELAEAVEVMVTELRETLAAEADAEEGDPPHIQSDAYFAAAGDVAAYLGDNCGFESLDVTATDYAFAGIPETASAGTTVLTMANDGTEFHEVALMQIAEGEERPLDELLGLPDEEVGELVTYKAFMFAPPEAQSYVTAELEPGRYVAICFIPVGATPEALESGASLDEGDSHFMHGMVTEFEVA